MNGTMRVIKHPPNLLVSQKDILAAVSYYLILQSPYSKPDNLEIILDKLRESMKKTTGFFLELGYWKVGEDIFRKELQNWMESIKEFTDLNNSKDGDTSPYKFTSAYDKDDPDSDFIDLDAFYNNVTLFLLRKPEYPLP